jgi:hypothetical protein
MELIAIVFLLAILIVTGVITPRRHGSGPKTLTPRQLRKRVQRGEKLRLVE